MSIPVSTVPAVKAALLNLVRAAVDPDAGSNDPTPLVVHSTPSEMDEDPDDLIVLGGTTRQTARRTMVGSGGGKWLFETYSIEVLVSVARGGDQAQATEQRAWHLVSLIENAVRGDPSIGGLVLVANPESTDMECDWAEGEAGARVATAVMKINFEAFI